MKKHYLEYSFDDDFLLFGLSVNERPHRIAWLINQALNFSFIRKDDLVLIGKDNQESFFARFDHHDELNRLTYHLLSNKDDLQPLLPEIRNIDYIMMIRGALEYFRKNRFTSGMREVENLQLITEIDHSTLKSQHNLIIPD